jgi:hypothetical protein
MAVLQTFENSVRRFGFSEETVQRSLLALRLVISQQDWYKKYGKESLIQIVKSWLATPEIQSSLE